MTTYELIDCDTCEGCQRMAAERGLLQRARSLDVTDEPAWLYEADKICAEGMALTGPRHCIRPTLKVHEHEFAA